MAVHGVRILGPIRDGYETILTDEAVEFVRDLVRRFTSSRNALLGRRAQLRRERLAQTRPWGPLPETRAVREGSWKVAPPPAIVRDRRVEITGPVERKMVINALNSGARVFMADFEDANTPSWDNLLAGQRNLHDAVRKTISYTAPDTGRRYTLSDRPAVLFARPRGLHLPERHVLVDGATAPGALFDVGLFLFHNAREQLARGAGPFFYLPKLESHLEARWYNEVFAFAEQALSLPSASIRATVLIETLPAAFEMDEILHELRERSLGLNCGRWDYIFSFIKERAHEPAAFTPDRAQLTMDRGFLRAYSRELIRVCHRRGAHAMGGMSALIPVKNDPAANESVLARVRADKLREVTDGHDGTWVAHPALVPVATEVFDAHMKSEHQIESTTSHEPATLDALLAVPDGPRTVEGARANLRVGVRYLESWLRGIGCVPLDHLMEDAATAEISRAQLWQQLRHALPLEGLGPLTREAYAALMDAELSRLREEVGPAVFEQGRFAEARSLFDRLVTADDFEEFLTLPAYEALRETLGD
jgi:malate synthase